MMVGTETCFCDKCHARRFDFVSSGKQPGINPCETGKWVEHGVACGSAADYKRRIGLLERELASVRRERYSLLQDKSVDDGVLDKFGKLNGDMAIMRNALEIIRGTGEFSVDIERYGMDKELSYKRVISSVDGVASLALKMVDREETSDGKQNVSNASEAAFGWLTEATRPTVSCEPEVGIGSSRVKRVSPSVTRRED